MKTQALWLGLLVGGCAVAGDVGEVTGGILVSPQGMLGVPSDVRLHRTRVIDAPCKTRSENPLAVDCTSIENVPGRFHSVTCVPAKACEISMKSAELAELIPLEERFQVRVEAEFEGKTEQVEHAFSATLPPGGSLSISELARSSAQDSAPEVYFEGGDVSACVLDARYHLLFEQTGLALPTQEERGRGPTCRFALLGPGNVRVSSVLPKPFRVAESRELNVLPIADVAVLEGALTYGESLPEQVPAYFMTGAVRGKTTDGRVGFIGNAKLMVDGGGVQVLPPVTGPYGDAKRNLVRLSGRPSSGMRVSVQAGDRILDVKVVGLP